MNMKIVAIVQARMGSTRLPGKVLKQLGDETVLHHVVERLKAVPLLDQIVIATTHDLQDDVMIKEAERLQVFSYRGSEQHVLSRYYEAALEYKADVVVRVTSDCPLLDPMVTNEVIGHYLREKVDYVSNTIDRSYPRGLDTEVFSFAALEKTNREAHTEAQFEHVTPYIYQNPQQFSLSFYKN